MRVPRNPPPPLQTFTDLALRPQRLLAIFQSVTSPTVDGKYLHWDKLRHLDPPGGLTHEEWWVGLKRLRTATKITLQDPKGNPFSFSTVDPLPRSLHEIDLMTGGSIKFPERVTNPESRDSYIVRSLIEEAFASSQLEGAASTREIAKELVREERKPRTQGERMILNNFKTMQLIREVKDQPLSRALVMEIHETVTRDTLDDPSGAGRFRKEDERRVVADDEGTIFHEPPPADELEARLKAMCDFANDHSTENFIHPAIRSMILHFWLAYDHPFIDGNGRTARALFYWSMLRRHYWLFEFVSISTTIMKSKIQYGQAFLETETDANDLTYFLIYHAKVIREAVQDLTESIARRSQIVESLRSTLRGMSALNYRQKELIVHALRHPGTLYTVESHRVSHGVSRQTAVNDLNDLVRHNLLIKQIGGRAHHYLARKDLEKKLARAT